MPKGPLHKHKYKGTFNWQREIHTFYRWAISTEHAKWLMLNELAKMLGISKRTVKHYFDGRFDNHSIERIKTDGTTPEGNSYSKS